METLYFLFLSLSITFDKNIRDMRAPDKNRILNTIKHIEQKEIPFLEIDPDMDLVNRILGKKFPLSKHSFELEAKDNVELNLKMGNDMVYFSHVWHLGRIEKEDQYGRLHYSDGYMKTREHLKDIVYPDIDNLKRKLDELCKEVQGTNMGVMYGSQTAAFTVMSAMGYQDYLLGTIVQPEFLLDFTSMLHEYNLKEMEVLMQYPIDMVKVASGLVIKTGPMVSYEQLEQFEMQFIREQAALTKSKNLPFFFHIDGKIDKLIPQFIDMGVDILNPVDPCGDTQDIFELKKQFGDKITFSGNIDIGEVLLNGTPEEVKANVIKHMEVLGKGGGYIVSSSHNLHELIPVENFYAMRDAVHSFTLN